MLGRRQRIMRSGSFEFVLIESAAIEFSVSILLLRYICVGAERNRLVYVVDVGLH